MRFLILIIAVITSVSLHADGLVKADNPELEFVLNNMVWMSEVKRFEREGFEVRMFKTASMDWCAALYSCRARERLYIATTEGDGGEGPVQLVYHLPEVHQWDVVSWDDEQPKVLLKSIVLLDNGQKESITYRLELHAYSASLERAD
ncbi:hypothetical protein ACQUQU_17440 [Thalassolituus sp. LLYu03]|uniref:hypothetical protein n=1 Tax=Thalassolituus sp. LLYu03 TaxID=3421656 RepID=UPI003D2D63D9